MPDEPTPAKGPPSAPIRVQRRQLALLGLALVAGLAIGWAIFHGGGDNDKSAAATTTATTPTTTADVKTSPATFKQLGLRFGRPTGWRTQIRKGTLEVSTGDRGMSLAVSMLPGHPSARTTRGSDRVELERIFRAHEVGRRRASVGKLGTIVTEMVGKTKSNHAVRILSMAVSSHFRTYSLQVFTVLKPPTARLVELQAMLNSFEFSAPK